MYLITLTGPAGHLATALCASPSPTAKALGRDLRAAYPGTTRVVLRYVGERSAPTGSVADRWAQHWGGSSGAPALNAVLPGALGPHVVAGGCLMGSCPAPRTLILSFVSSCSPVGAQPAPGHGHTPIDDVHPPTGSSPSSLLN